MSARKVTIVLTEGEGDALRVTMEFDPPLQKNAEPSVITTAAGIIIDAVTKMADSAEDNL